MGRIYPEYRGGDKWAWKLGKIRGIKGGDSAIFMGLIGNGLNAEAHLTSENWGGRIKQDKDNPHHYHDVIDRVGNYRKDVSPYLAAVYRWRPTFQSDYAARFDWCVKPYRRSNHAPTSSNGTSVIDKNIVAGQRVKLRGGDWRDPDKDKLSYHWRMLTSESGYSKDIRIRNRSSRFAEFRAPAVHNPQSVHMLLKVTDNGHPALSSYKRINFTIRPY